MNPNLLHEVLGRLLRRRRGRVVATRLASDEGSRNRSLLNLLVLRRVSGRSWVVPGSRFIDRRLVAL
jgi:hypothetical protein